MNPAIARRVTDVMERIGAAAERSGRAPADTTLIAVSKTFGVKDILEGLGAGITDFGENRAQEFKQKVAAVGERARWHFVGYLQTNKVRHVVGSARLVHSVDRFGLAEAISRRARRAGITQDVLIQVNVAGELSKEGVDSAQALALAEKVARLPHVRVRGLMTIPPYPESPEESRPYYKELADLGARLRDIVPDARDLSMGMTRDFEVAVEEGATLVRVGEAIFGTRAR